VIRIERSAGFVVFHVDPATSTRRYLLLDYGNYWDYPKGHVEKGEDDLTAARRELQEETGISHIELIDGFTREMTYFFRAKGRLVKKSVIFFLARTEETTITVSHEHEAGEFVEFEAAVRKLKFSTSKELLRAAEAFLSPGG